MIHVGTSGFSYPYWKGRFYPDDLPSSKWLAHYADTFDTLEINYTFYRFPTIRTLENTANKTPDDFLITVKAHKIITHTMRMRDAAEKINEFTAICEAGLGNKLACILFQLPPSYSFTPERLEDILTNVPSSGRNAIEFRHASWWNQTVFDALSAHHLTFCNVSYPGLPDQIVLTSDIFYLRMHGVPDLFKSAYSETRLQALADSLQAGTSGFIYFNNTTFEAGYENARSLKRLLS